MVDDEVQRNAEELRDIAAKLRRLAQQTRSSDARQRLIELAGSFDRMAGQLGGASPPDGED